MNTLKTLTAAAALMLAAGAAYAECVKTPTNSYVCGQTTQATQQPAKAAPHEPTGAAQAQATGTIYGLASCVSVLVGSQGHHTWTSAEEGDCRVEKTYASLTECQQILAQMPASLNSDGTASAGHVRGYFIKWSCLQKTVPLWEQPH
jgi:hypothetical protein